MIVLTAILKVRPEATEQVEKALLQVAEHALAHEPGTLGYHVGRGLDDRCVFTTYERFANRAAMEDHNRSAAVARFFEEAGPLLAEPATVAICEEIVPGEAGRHSSKT